MTRAIHASEVGSIRSEQNWRRSGSLIRRTVFAFASVAAVSVVASAPGFAQDLSGSGG